MALFNCSDFVKRRVRQLCFLTVSAGPKYRQFAVPHHWLLDHSNSTALLTYKVLGPTRRRMIQQALVRDWGLSIRSSCRLAGISRSHLNQPRLIDEDALRAEIRRLAYQHPRFGYRRIHALLKKGWKINVKRVRRIWREEGPFQSPSTSVRRDMDALGCKSKRNVEDDARGLA